MHQKVTPAASPAPLRARGRKGTGTWVGDQHYEPGEFLPETGLTRPERIKAEKAAKARQRRLDELQSRMPYGDGVLFDLGDGVYAEVRQAERGDWTRWTEMELIRYLHHATG